LPKNRDFGGNFLVCGLYQKVDVELNFTYQVAPSEMHPSNVQAKWKNGKLVTKA